MAHVFIVDEKTLPIHLKYQFAGTGARDLKCDFLINMDDSIASSTERMLTGMIADISRIRPGDDILFYLRQNKNHDGMFFGSFKAIDRAFLCDNDYLEEELGKNLTFRIRITPGTVYSNGITERDCLDSLDGISHPSQMCWSLIYRKLRANRGCTMITDFEYEQIMNKIKRRNTGALNSNYYDYDKESNQIIVSDSSYEYTGNEKSLDIKNRLLYKLNSGRAYETHLQAYIVQNLHSIADLKINDANISWIGNEVSCGVGMQSIDVSFIQEDNNEVNFVICELKDEQPIQYIQKQIEKYVSWLIDYIVPNYNKKIIIHPTIIAPKPKSKTENMIKNIINSTVSNSNNLEVKSIRYIAFSNDGNNLIFKNVKFE